jgi:hypothetical protein
VQKSNLPNRAGVLGFVKIALGYTPMKSEKVALLDPIWATVQQTCSVICCCAPLFKALVPKTSTGLAYKIRISLFSRGSGSRSRTVVNMGQGEQKKEKERWDADGLKRPEKASVASAKKHSGESIVLDEYDERADSFRNVHLPPFQTGDNHV